jgi:hypothetical protein
MVTKDHVLDATGQGHENPDAQHFAYVPLPDHYAVHDRAPGTPAPGAVLLLEDGAIAVFRGAPDERTRGSASVGPVYRSDQGRLAVPTGRVLVRFSEGVQAASRRDDLEQAGFEIEETLAYAPQAAWVRCKEGGVADALAYVARLRKLADVENVEPQMLTPSVQR